MSLRFNNSIRNIRRSSIRCWISVRFSLGIRICRIIMHVHVRIRISIRMRITTRISTSTTGRSLDHVSRSWRRRGY